MSKKKRGINRFVCCCCCGEKKRGRTSHQNIEETKALFFWVKSPNQLFSSLLFSLCITKNKKMDKEKEFRNKETEKLFEGVENGDEEVVKVLLLWKQKQTIQT